MFLAIVFRRSGLLSLTLNEFPPSTHFLSCHLLAGSSLQSSKYFFPFPPFPLRDSVARVQTAQIPPPCRSTFLWQETSYLCLSFLFFQIFSSSSSLLPVFNVQVFLFLHLSSYHVLYRHFCCVHTARHFCFEADFINRTNG